MQRGDRATFFYLFIFWQMGITAQGVLHHSGLQVLAGRMSREAWGEGGCFNYSTWHVVLCWVQLLIKHRGNVTKAQKVINPSCKGDKEEMWQCEAGGAKIKIILKYQNDKPCHSWVRRLNVKKILKKSMNRDEAMKGDGIKQIRFKAGTYQESK